MFVLEYKVKPKPHQIEAINEAIRTTKFVRNKVWRYWMDNRGVGKVELFRYNTRLRKEFNFVNDLNSHACQAAVERTLRAITRFYGNCQNNVKGKKGYPQFKKHSRSVEYKVSGWKLSDGKRHITFTDKKGIGKVKLIGSRDINYYQPEPIKRFRIINSADGYYVQFCIKLDPRDTIKPLNPSKQATGIDVGLKFFLVDAQANQVDGPQLYRQSEKQLNRLNRRKSKKYRPGQKQSRNYHQARQGYAKKHLRVSRQREELVKRVALRLIQSNDLVVCEDLNIRGMFKNHGLAKSITDAGWATFRRWLEYFGEKYSKLVIAVPPHNTSQNCSNCGPKVEKSLSTRTHVCPNCGYIDCRERNAAINILPKGLSMVGRTKYQASGDLSSSCVGEILLNYGESVNEESPRL